MDEEQSTYNVMTKKYNQRDKLDRVSSSSNPEGTKAGRKTLQGLR